MNKFNIDEHVFFTENSIEDPKSVNITLGQVLKIEKIDSQSGHSQINYTVKCLYAVTHEKRRWEGPKIMSEDCLYRDFTVIQSIVNKTRRNFYKKPKANK